MYGIILVISYVVSDTLLGIVCLYEEEKERVYQANLR